MEGPCLTPTLHSLAQNAPALAPWHSNGLRVSANHQVPAQIPTLLSQDRCCSTTPNTNQHSIHSVGCCSLRPTRHRGVRYRLLIQHRTGLMTAVVNRCSICVNTGPSFGDGGQQLLHSRAWFLPSTNTFSSNMRRVHTSSTAAATPMPAPLLVTAGVHPENLGSAAAASHTVRGAAPAAATGALRGRQSCCATHSCIVKHGLHPAHRHVQSTH